MLGRLLLPFALILSPAPAVAQDVIFHTSFEGGLAGWTATGLWNAEAAADPCAAGISPFPGGTGVAYYGTTSCNYDTPGATNSGSLTWDSWIDLPAGAASISLRFWSWNHTEYCWANWDVHEVELVVEGGTVWTGDFCGGSLASEMHLPWHERRLDITGLAGSRVRPRFQFDTRDVELNEFRGWYVDEVSILVEPGVRVCPSPSLASGCPCGSSFVPVAGGCRNSTNQSAVLLSSGVPVVSADTLRFDARNLPPSAACLLAQAPAQGTSIVFGDGLRCVSGSVRRMGSQAASNGHASWPPPGTDPIALRGLVPPTGGTRYYYVYYRDVLPYCNAASFNLTDTQRIVWTP